MDEIRKGGHHKNRKETRVKEYQKRGQGATKKRTETGASEFENDKSEGKERKGN